MCVVHINEDMDNEIDNMIADNDRVALPYRRLPESVDVFQNEICKVFYHKELKTADYLSHKFHYNRHLRVMATNISLTRIRIWDKYCNYNKTFIVNLMINTNRLLAKTKEYVKYAFQVLQLASGGHNSGITIPDVICHSEKFYEIFANSFNNSDYKQLTVKVSKQMADSWIPYLKTVLKLKNNNRLSTTTTTTTSDCKPLNTTYDPTTTRIRVSKQMALFDTLDALMKVK
ncbi:uncharacterized protein LOC128954514 isoform X2 [Oppia nitens]|uniref:uncharacterized protein LOC128954514 isoform X2 n=1 Tax=Oppia nitens TaxID=1686743 RepID=UPI0023DC545C|nr:uncharacterized protein LOC128954514 isoform X2 [Oppia nitens]